MLWGLISTCTCLPSCFALYTWCYSGPTLLCMIGTVAATPGLSSLCCLCQVKWHGHAQYHRIYKFCCHCYPPMPMSEIVPRVCMLVAWVLLGLKVGWCPSEGMLPKSKYNISACCYGSYEWLLLCITTVAASAYTLCWGMCIPSTLAAALWKAGCLELPALLLESKCSAHAHCCMVHNCCWALLRPNLLSVHVTAEVKTVTICLGYTQELIMLKHAQGLDLCMLLFMP